MLQVVSLQKKRSKEHSYFLSKILIFMFELFLFMLLNLLGTISPGPDFATVTHYGLSGSRRNAYLATFGIVTALFIHVFYCVSGVAIFLSSSKSLFYIVQILGSSYLTYLGIKALLPQSTSRVKEKKISKNPFLTGFFCNLLNPKATLFLLSLFTRFASSMNTSMMKISYALCIPCIALLWFISLSFLLTHPKFLPFLQRFKSRITFCTGLFILFLGLSGFISLLLK